jgi:flagellar hook-associated protein 3 FlgL
MRVTYRMLTHSFLQGIFKNLGKMEKIQESIASGKQINKPSDDPIGITQVLNYKEILSSLGQYKKNIDQGTNWLNISSSALTGLKDLIVRVQEIAMTQASSTANQSTRLNAAQEIGLIYNQVIQLGNTKQGNRYIFAGHKTNTPPFSSTGVYNGDDGEINFEINPGVSMLINVSGNKVFKGSGGGKDILTILSDLKIALENNDQGGVAGQLDGLNIARDQAIDEISYAGVSVSRLESSKERMLDLEMEITKLLSETEDVDIAKAIVDLNAKQLAYEASLSAAKRVIQNSLVDFLR